MKELTLVEEMANEGYGCAVANRFGQLLDDESDPFDILFAAGVGKKQQQKKKKEEQKKTSTTTKPGKKESQRDRTIVLPAVGGGQGNLGEGRGNVTRRSMPI